MEHRAEAHLENEINIDAAGTNIISDADVVENYKNRFIDMQNVTFTYLQPDDPDEESNAMMQSILERDNAIDHVSLTVKKGEYIVILGRNGSGKSTLAKLLNALLLPTGGTVLIKGMPTVDPKYLWEIRRASGMVFQNPDNQIVGTTVEEDIAFGVENLGVPSGEIRMRIDEAMKTTGVYDLAERAPYQLSGGQKQRVAIAGILAMKPECIILDEATAMLDPDGRREVLSLVGKLNKEEHIAVVHITHHMDEVKPADRVIVIDEGKAIMVKTPKELFMDAKRIKHIGLEVPQITEIFDILRERGFDMPKGIIDIDTAYEVIEKMIGRNHADTG